MNAEDLHPLEPPANDELSPRCDLMTANEADAAVLGLMKQEFIAVYREINHCVRDLRAIQAAPHYSAESERGALQAVERAILARDALENKYARLGMIATPIVQNGFIREIQIATPPAPAMEEPSIISMCFTVMPPSCHAAAAQPQANIAEP